jgi:hypothetical protein
MRSLLLLTLLLTATAARGAEPPPAPAPMPPYPCYACQRLQPERPALLPDTAITFPSRDELVAPGWREPADLAAYGALRSTRCLDGTPDCLLASGMRFDGLAQR